MTINLNAIVAIAGCIALFGFWLFNVKSGFRGFLLVCSGCALIFLGYMGPGYLTTLAGIAVAGGVLVLLLFSLSKLMPARGKRGPRYQQPLEISGTCSNCGHSARLNQYQQGWLCRTCANEISKKAA